MLIDETYAGPLRDWLGTFHPSSLLILDEAHHAAPSSSARYAIDSHITRAVRDLAPRFEHRLFLSATPHNGHSNCFSASLEILDPQRFCRGVRVSKKMLEDVMVRRLKDDLREVVGGFPKREVVQVDVKGLPSDAPELQLAAWLDDYRVLREQRLTGESRRTQTAAGLLICALQQRLLSSVEAFARTLRVHRRTVQKQWDQAKAQAGADRLKAELLIEPVDSDDDRVSLNEEDLAAEEDAVVAAVSEATRGSEHAAPELFRKEQQLLDKMSELAESSRFMPAARVNQLISWIRTNMCPDLGTAGAKWNNTRVIVFTEYEDTRRYLQQQLGGAIASSDQAEPRIAVYHGPTPVKEREDIKIAFNTEPEKNPVRILIATDAAREGLNLQAHCWNLFHFDVPWNPSRMEQRNGRVDRKLQPSKIVRCHYFFYVQRPEDRVIAALVKKTKIIREELGSLSQVIDRRLDTLLKTGIRRKEVDTLTRSIETLELEKEGKQVVEDELEAARERQLDLRNQIERLSTMLSRSQQEIGFSKDHFRSAVSCSLEILGAEKLNCSGNHEMRCQFPPLDQREGSDPSWGRNDG